jgi:hypothetical protein
LTLNENSFNPRILYPAKLSFKIDEEIKVFHESKQNCERTGNTKPQEKKRQESRE